VITLVVLVTTIVETVLELLTTVPPAQPTLTDLTYHVIVMMDIMRTLKTFVLFVDQLAPLVMLMVVLLVQEVESTHQPVLVHLDPTQMLTTSVKPVALLVVLALDLQDVLPVLKTEFQTHLVFVHKEPLITMVKLSAQPVPIDVLPVPLVNTV